MSLQEENMLHISYNRYIKNPDVVIKMDARSGCLKSIMHSVGLLSTWKTFKSSPYQFHCMSEKELLSKSQATKITRKIKSLPY